MQRCINPEFEQLDKTGIKRHDATHETRIAPREEWLDLHAVTSYAAVSVNTAARGSLGTELLVRKSDFDAYLEWHRVKPLGEIDIESVVRTASKAIDVLRASRIDQQLARGVAARAGREK